MFHGYFLMSFIPTLYDNRNTTLTYDENEALNVIFGREFRVHGNSIE